MTPQTEFTKTTVAVAAAAVLSALVYALGPSGTDYVPDKQLGATFFEFEPLKADSLEIVEYLPDNASVRKLAVEKDAQGRWVIPSHEKYPTDAKERLGQAAATVRYAKRGSQISASRGDHETFGVVDPEKENQPGVKGIGTRVSIKQGGKEIAALIVGKADKDKSDLRYVRIAGQDEVYLSKLDLTRLSTKFEDWIQTDLLEMQGFSLKEVTFDNYTLDIVGRQLQVQQGEVLRADYDDKKNEPKDRWSLFGLPRGAKAFEPLKFAPGEEPNVETLDALKSALDDLKIVNVKKKPADLVAILNGKGKELSDEAYESLQSKGFFLTPKGQLVSKEGTIEVALEDGVRYVLRFGLLASDRDARLEPGAKGERRYLFVQASLDPSMIPPPVEEKYVPKTGAANPSAAGLLALADEATPPAAPAAAPAQPAAPAAEAAPLAEDPEKKRVEAVNAQRKKEYQEKIKKAQERVEQLNERFADWYYVIDGEVYKKIHLDRAQLVKRSGAPAGDAAPPGDGPLDFKKLQEGIDAP